MLKKELEKLSATVYTESDHPLIFIVDELDRCRPTFAIELLERVKHIFDVPNLVFAFGLNRDELSNVYLRRFFDFEFNLPQVDSRGFAEQLIDRFQLAHVFQGLSDMARDQVHLQDYDNYRTIFPRLWSALGLSLRDIDYGIRLLALLTRSLRPRTLTYPFLLVVLIAMKFKKPEFYRSLITGDFRTSEIMDYIDEELKGDLVDDNLTRFLDRIEGFLYCTDRSNTEDQQRGENAHTELLRLSQGDVEFGFQIISRRAQSGNPEQSPRMIRAIEDGHRLEITGDVFGHLAALIDTYQAEVKR